MAYAGIECLALTDHDTLKGLPEAREEARKLGIELISGVEISADFQGQDDIHILALFVDEENADLNARLLERQENRRSRGERMAQKLGEAGFALDLDASRAEVGDGVWGRPHLARGLVRAGHASSHDDAFARFLGREHPWYVGSDKWPVFDVLRAVREAGGVTSVAHAVWYKDAENLIRSLASAGRAGGGGFSPGHGPGEGGPFGDPPPRRRV